MGNEEEIHQHVWSKVDLWTNMLSDWLKLHAITLSIATLPSRGHFPGNWAVLQRVVGDCDEEHVPLHDVVMTIFIPLVLGSLKCWSRSMNCLSCPRKMGVWLLLIRRRSRFFSVEEGH